MRNRSTYEKLISDPRRRQRIEEEEFILKITEDLVDIMKEKGLTKTQIATQLGNSRAFISQILNGSRNMTLRTLFRLTRSMGYNSRLYFSKVEVGRRQSGKVIKCEFQSNIPKVHMSLPERLDFGKEKKIAG